MHFLLLRTRITAIRKILGMLGMLSADGTYKSSGVATIVVPTPINFAAKLFGA